VNLCHHRLFQSDTEFGEDRHEDGSKCIDLLLRFPDIEDLDFTVRFECDVEGTPFGRSRTSCLELFDRALVLLRCEPLVNELDPECHDEPPFPRAGRGLDAMAGPSRTWPSSTIPLCEEWMSASPVAPDSSPPGCSEDWPTIQRAPASRRRSGRAGAVGSHRQPCQLIRRAPQASALTTHVRRELGRRRNQWPTSSRTSLKAELPSRAWQCLALLILPVDCLPARRSTQPERPRAGG
jgi:hypothetical protein